MMFKLFAKAKFQSNQEAVMLRLRKIFGVLIVILATFLLPQTTFAQDSADEFKQDDSWIFPSWYQPGLQGVLFSEQTVSLPWSYLTQANKDTFPLAEDPTCDSLESTKCDAKVVKNFTSVFPVCEKQDQINCISEFSASKSGDDFTVAKFVQYFPLKVLNAFVGNDSRHVPTGSSSSIWSIPSLPHAGGDLYLLNISVVGDVFPNVNEARISNFTASIWPVRIIDLHQCDQLAKSAGNCDSGFQIGFNMGGGNPNERIWMKNSGPGPDGIHNCVSKSQGFCAEKFGFPEFSRFQFKLKTNALPTGWLHGRLTDPNISIKPSSSFSELTVSAAPTRVPIVAKKYNWDEMPIELRNKYSTTTGGFKEQTYISGITQVYGSNELQSPDPYKRSYWSLPSASGILGIHELNAWLPYIDDKATASNSIWKLRTLSGDERNNENSCFADTTNVTGIVTTNATEYSAGPPVLDASTGSLIYQVAAPHFMSTGKVFKGNYDLVMRSDVARCLYKFSNAPINATIEITSEDGNQQVAATTLSERDGWIHLNANGFTFSSPIIRVKLSQPSSSVESSSPTPTSSVSSHVSSSNQISINSKKTVKTILCERGKSFKKVVGTKPVCPTGYKLKK